LWHISFAKKHFVVAKFSTEKFVAFICTLSKAGQCNSESLSHINLSESKFPVTFIQPSNKLGTWKRVIEQLMLTQVANKSPCLLQTLQV
jgi:hypothetical protein